MPATPPATDPTRWLETPADLSATLQTWSEQPLVALDTEFIRERTYWPQLALVQLAVPGEVVLVDVLVPGMVAALAPLLSDPNVVKLMHSAGEDLLALRIGVGVLPAPLYDTQIAAALTGLGASLSYQKLVEHVTGLSLPKDETRSNWLQRPLSPAQRAYAADDVRHLHALHAALETRLGELGRHAWHRADCARAVAQALRDDPEPWPHLALRSAQFLDRPAQMRLCRLLHWRDAQARTADKPRSWILDNELAVALARTPPPTPDALRAWLAAHPKAPRRLGASLWEALEAATDDPTLPLASPQDNAYKARLRRLQDAVAGETERLALPEGVLASRRSLEALLRGDGWPEALHGWRQTLLAPILEPLL